MDLYDIVLLVIGVIVLAAALAPRLLARQPITAPLFFMLLGTAVFLLLSLLPFVSPYAQLPDLIDDVWWIKRVTELVVIIALTSAGLKLNYPYAWSTWRISVRLLLITMPLTILATSLLGWWVLGFVPATALLLGAVIAPTDPVLAADVQTSAPSKPDGSSVRVALTTEAGLNDGLAFPFTYLAIAWATVGIAPADWLTEWLLIDVGYKIVVGLLVGVVLGWLLGKLVFGLSRQTQLAHTMTGILVISLTLIPYAVTELVGGYGFIAVFVAACVFRQAEENHAYQQALHDMAEEFERVLVAVTLFWVGGYLVTIVWTGLSWSITAVALITVFIIRPLAGWVALFYRSPLRLDKQAVVAFFGIRGLGSIYYLAYATFHAEFAQVTELWTVVLLVVVISVFVHGLSAGPAMRKLDERRGVA